MTKSRIFDFLIQAGIIVHSPHPEGTPAEFDLDLSHFTAYGQYLLREQMKSDSVLTQKDSDE